MATSEDLRSAGREIRAGGKAGLSTNWGRVS